MRNMFSLLYENIFQSVDGVDGIQSYCQCHKSCYNNVYLKRVRGVYLSVCVYWFQRYLDNYLQQNSRVDIMKPNPLFVCCCLLYTGCFRVISKSKTRKQTLHWGLQGLKTFFLLTLQTGSKFAMDKRNIKDVYFSQFQQQEKSAILQILHV